MSKSVLYIGGFELPDRNAAAQRVIANSKIFSTLGYDIYLYGISHNKVKVNNSFCKLDLENFSFFYNEQKYPKTLIEWGRYLSDCSSVIDILKNRQSNNIDIVVAYNYPSIKLFKLYNYCKTNGIKLIADVTEWYVPTGNIFFRLLKASDTAFRMKYVHKKLDGLITISNFLSDFYKSQNILELPPLVDLKECKWKNKIKDKDRIINLCYVGSPGSGMKDRLDLIINSLFRIKNQVNSFHFHIVGISKQQYLTSFENSERLNEIDNLITFYGRQSHKKALSILKESTFTVFLRENNLVNTAGFPTKFVESVSCGVPVLTNISSNLDFYINKEKLGFELSIDSNEALDESLKESINKPFGEIIKAQNHCKDFVKFNFLHYKDSLSLFINKISK